jgi:CRISPR-associated endonuclease cas1, NMENI subtype
MGWRTIIIEQSQQVSLHLDNLKIKMLEGDYLVPLQDISIVIFNNYKLNVTTQLLCKMSRYQICVIICEKNGLPSVVMNPIAGNYVTFKNQEIQLNMDSSRPGDLWKAIIERKIDNQISVLDHYSLSLDTIETMESLKSTIQPLDIENHEGIAAKVYFKALFGVGFVRDREEGDPLNNALNYGYSIVRALMARALAAKGLLLSIGIKHHNIYNHFNLVDDCMEIYRPIIDDWVYFSMYKTQALFSRDLRLNLVSMLSEVTVRHQNLSYSIADSMNRFADSLIRCMTDSNEVLDLPLLDN